MATLGQQWRRQVSRDETNYQVLHNGITQRELEARSWVEQLRRHDLESGIASCISRDSDSLAIPMDTRLVATDAVRSLMISLAAEGIVADIAIDAEGPGSSLLLLTPVE